LTETQEDRQAEENGVSERDGECEDECEGRDLRRVPKRSHQ